MHEGAVTGLIGVYDADGGLLGEAAYVWGKVRGARHCSLCDITHGTVRRKPEWDRMVAELGTPVDLVHLNEMPTDVRDAVAACGAPVVLARTVDGVHPLVLADELDDLHGSVERLGTILRERIGSVR